LCEWVEGVCEEEWRGKEEGNSFSREGLRTAEMFSSPLLKIFLRLSQDLNNHFKNNYKSAP